MPEWNCTAMEDKEPADSGTPWSRRNSRLLLSGAGIGLDSADAVMAGLQETILTVIQKRCEQEAHQGTDGKAESD
jgi:hypothetical protein